MSKPERVVQLIAFIREDHPRAASLLHWHWGRDDFDVIMDELLTYSGDRNRQGFDTEIFSALLELQKIHSETKPESEEDPWSHAKP